MALTLTITNAGRAALINADGSGTRAVRVARVGVSGSNVVASAAATTLPGEVKRIDTLSGDKVAADVIHLVVRDESMAVYTVRSLGLYLDDGTLFALYGQADPIVEKSAQALLLLAIDVTLQDVAAGQITFGNANFLLPPATTERLGLIELATDTEAAALLDAVRALTPKNMAAIFTAANVLSRLISVDGAGSGLDADLVDGRHATEFALLSGATFTGSIYCRDLYASRGDGTGVVYLNAAQDRYLFCDGINYFLANGQLFINGARAWNASNDGAGSGMDADLLDGRQATEFALLTGATFTGSIYCRDLYASRGDGTGAVYLNAAQSRYLFCDGTDYFLPNGRLYLNGSLAWSAANDGAGSGMDADLLDGQQGSWYADIPSRLGFSPLPAASYTAADVLAKLITVDGAGSGVDADLLDGRQGSEFALLTGAIFSGAVGRDALFYMQLFGTLAQIVFGTNAQINFDRQNRIFNFSIDGANPLLVTKDGAVVGENLALKRANAGRYLHYADGAINGDTITRGINPPAGGADGDQHIQIDTAAGIMHLWHNYAGTWVHN